MAGATGYVTGDLQPASSAYSPALPSQPAGAGPWQGAGRTGGQAVKLSVYLSILLISPSIYHFILLSVFPSPALPSQPVGTLAGDGQGRGSGYLSIYLSSYSSIPLSLYPSFKYIYYLSINPI